jgi:hypothetical protein
MKGEAEMATTKVARVGADSAHRTHLSPRSLISVEELIQRLQRSRETLWGVEDALKLLADSDEDLRSFLGLLRNNLDREGETLELVQTELAGLLKDPKAVA